MEFFDVPANRVRRRPNPLNNIAYILVIGSPVTSQLRTLARPRLLRRRIGMYARPNTGKYRENCDQRINQNNLFLRLSEKYEQRHSHHRGQSQR